MGNGEFCKNIPDIIMIKMLLAMMALIMKGIIYIDCILEYDPILQITSGFDFQGIQFQIGKKY